MVRVALLALALTGCGSGFGGCSASGTGDQQGKPGDLGRGSFRYRCVLESDPVCDEGGTDFPLERRIAVGASVGLSFLSKDGESSSVASAAIDLLAEVEDDTFQANERGDVAILVFDERKNLFDLTHIALEIAESIAIEVGDGTFVVDPTAVTLTAGQAVEARATVRDHQGDMLAGGLLCDWDSSDPEIVGVSTPSSDNVALVEAVAPGVSTLSVQLGGLHQEITITVEEAVGTGGAGGGGGGASAGGAGGGS